MDIDDAVKLLAARIADRPSDQDRLADALALGKVVVEQVFKGDHVGLSSRSPSSPSFRTFAEDERVRALGVSRRALADHARVYMQSLVLPDDLLVLTLGQRQKLLRLEPAAQVEVGRLALAEGWSLRVLDAEVRRRKPPNAASKSKAGAKARLVARDEARRATTALAGVKLHDLSDAALVALSEELGSAISLAGREAASRGLELAVLQGVAQRSATTPTPRARRRRGAGSLTDAYRPMRFDEVVGNTEAVEKLRALAKARSKMPLLLYGPPGTGKTTLALIYCRAVVCTGTRPQGCEPCGECDVCELCETPTSAPLLGGIGTVGAAATGDAREAAQDVINSLESPWDGVVVNEADRLLIQQQRLFDRLEVLDGRPLVFCTTDIKKFDEQFKSRCGDIGLNPIAKDEMLAFLTEVALAESVTITKDQLQGVLRDLGKARAGQARDTLNMLEGLIANARAGSEPGAE